MLTWLWQRTPGPTSVKVLVALILVVVIFLLLMEVVFPWVSMQMPYSDVAL